MKNKTFLFCLLAFCAALFGAWACLPSIYHQFASLAGPGGLEHLIPFLAFGLFVPGRDIQIRDIQGTGSGNTAIINCPKGPRYRRLILTLGDTGLGNANAPSVASIVDEIKVIVGSKTIRKFTGAQIDLINQTNGTRYASYGVTGGSNGAGRTYLPLFFEEPWRKRADFANGLALETGWMDSNGVFQVQVKLQSTTTTPVLGCLAFVDDFSSGKPNPIMKFYCDDANTTSASLDLANLFQGAPASDLVESMSLFDPSDSSSQSKQVTVARLLLNGIVVIDDETVDQQFVKLQTSDMFPAVGAYHIVFDHDDLFESLRQVGGISSSQLTLTLKASSTGTLRRVTQRLGDPTL